MRLLSCDIYKLITFKFSEITRLELTFDTETQIIIGTNGSGKTHLLSQLSLLPPTRPEYDKTGYKLLQTTHFGNEYVISSRFKEKGSPHGFYKNGVNLNVSGNTDIQLELLQEHLGYNKVVDDIIFNRVDIVRMRVGDRKKYMLEHNPSNLGFMLTLYKKINSHIKGLNTTIRLLEERKIELFSQLLSNDEISTYTTEKNKKEKALQFYMNRISELKTILAGLPEKIENYNNDTLRSKIKSLRVKTNINIKKYNLYLNEVGICSLTDLSLYDENKKNIHTLNVVINKTLDEMTEINATILQLEQKLENLKPIDVMLELESKAEQHTKALNLLKDVITQTPLSKNDLLYENEILDIVSNVCDSVLNIDIPIYTQTKREIKREHVRYYTSVLNNVNYNLSETEEQLLQLYPQIKNISIPTPCSGFKCPLYKQYMDNGETIKLKVKQLENTKSRLLLRKNRLVEYLSKQNTQLEEIKTTLQKLQPLIYLKNKYNFLKNILTNDNFDKFLYSPFVYKRKIIDLFTFSKNTHEYNTLTQELQDIKITLNGMDVSLHENTVFVKDQLNDLYKKFNNLQQELILKQDKLKQCLTYIEDYDDRQKHVTLLENELKSTSEYIDAIKTNHQRKKILFELDYLYNKKNETGNELSLITTTINNQNSINDRYTNEVLSQLNKYKTLKQKLSDITFVLNKIPIEQTILFINNIINGINKYIDIVFTYDFYILPLDIRLTDIDYMFKVQVGEVTVPDISLCSDAQKEMLNLAFNLTMRQLLKLEDYPLYLDECGKTFDSTHKQRLLTLLQHLLDSKAVSQLFIVNHHAMIHEGLTNSQTLVLNPDNILTPANYNQHAMFNNKTKK